MISLTWNLPPKKLNLPLNQVHLWRVWLRQPLSRIHHLSTLLSDDEKERAARFYFEPDKHKFIIGRGVLRQILSRYLSIQPTRLQFSYGPQGKPALAKTHHPDQTAFKFNVAHSRELALYAFAHNREIGVDIEYIRHLEDMDQMANRFFSTPENSVFQSLPVAQKPTAFFNCWTRKEAYLKARGDGLTHPLDQFDVTLRPGKQAKLLDVYNDPNEAGRWSLQALSPAPNYVAALAVEGNNWNVAGWQTNFSLYERQS